MNWENDMDALAWWIIPVIAGVLAALWVGWSARTRSVGDSDSLTKHRRFREAMERGPQLRESRERVLPAGQPVDRVP